MKKAGILIAVFIFLSLFVNQALAEVGIAHKKKPLLETVASSKVLALHDQLKTVPIGVFNQNVRAVVYTDQSPDADVYACFLPNLARARFRDTLSRFHIAARDRPSTTINAAYE